VEICDAEKPLETVVNLVTSADFTSRPVRFHNSKEAKCEFSLHADLKTLSYMTF